MNRNTILKMLLNQGKWIELTSPPPLTLTKSLGKDLKNYKIYGNSTQNGTPSPSSPVEIENTGDRTKNYYDNTKTVIHNGNYYMSGYLIPVKKNTNYVISAINVTSQPVYGIRGYTDEEYTSNPTKSFLWSGGTSINYNTTKFNSGSYAYISFRIWNSSETYGVTDNSKFQLEEGTSKTSFEPYGYKIPVITSDGTNSTTTNIYLDEPLRKVGNYADYIDFENQKEVRQIKEVYINSSDGLNVYNYNNLHGISFQNKLDANYTRETGLSDYENRIGKYYTTTGHYMWLGVGSKLIYWIGILDELGIYDANKTNQEMIDEFKDWLGQNQICVIYPSTTATEKSITLPNMPSLKGTTTYSIDTTTQPSNMYVKYKGK